MKKLFTFPNIQAAIFLVLCVAETVILLLFKPLPIITILLMQFVMLLCIAIIRFAYPLAFWHNIWHSFWNRKNYKKEDDEPSAFAVVFTKAVGYFFLLVSQIILFL